VFLRGAGTAGQQLLVLEIQNSSESGTENKLVADYKGAILYANRGASSLLGYKPREMAGRLNITHIIDAPFAQLHPNWLKVIGT
jgi:PAS domain S-box-containing protein